MLAKREPINKHLNLKPNDSVRQNPDQIWDSEIQPIFVGIAGGTASGKTTVTDDIFKRVRVGTPYNECCMIPFDCFYKECTDEQMADIGNVNFDHPQIFDWDLLKETLQSLREGNDVILPDYDYKTCKRRLPGILRKWAPLIILEGIFALLDRDINAKFLDFKIFVLTDDDIRLARRIKRDIVERGRNVAGVLKSYHKFVKPAHIEFVRPTMKYADLIVPRGRPMESSRNLIAIDFIVQNLEHKLVERGFVLDTPSQQTISLTAQPLKNYEFEEQISLLFDIGQKRIFKETILKQMLADLLLKLQQSNPNLQWSQQYFSFNQVGKGCGPCKIQFIPVVRSTSQITSLGQQQTQIWALFETNDVLVSTFSLIGGGSLVRLENLAAIAQIEEDFNLTKMFFDLPDFKYFL